MDLGDILGPEQIIPGMKREQPLGSHRRAYQQPRHHGQIKRENLDAISSVVKKARILDEHLASALAIGIPHASTDLIYEVVGALGRSKRGSTSTHWTINRSTWLCCSSFHRANFQKHLHTLANIAKLLHRAEFRQALEQAPDAAAMLQIIRDQGHK